MKRGDYLIDLMEGIIPPSKIHTTIFSGRNNSAGYLHFGLATNASPIIVFYGGCPSGYKKHTWISTPKHGKISYSLVAEKTRAIIST